MTILHLTEEKLLELIDMKADELFEAIEQIKADPIQRNWAYDVEAYDMTAIGVAARMEERNNWVVYASAYSAWAYDVAELLEEKRDDLDPEDWEDQKLLALMDQAEAGIVNAYRAARGINK